MVEKCEKPVKLKILKLRNLGIENELH